MALIHLPLLKGQDQSVDPKIAPLGVLRSAKNVRFDREGRIIKRPGFDALSVLSQSSGTPIGSTTFAFLDTSPGASGIKAVFDRDGEMVAVAGHRVCSYSQAAGLWRDWNPITLWSAPERFEVGRNLIGRTLRPSVAYCNGYVCVVWEANDGTTFRVYAAVYDAVTMARVSFVELATTGAKRPRVVAIGNKFVTAYMDTVANFVKVTNFDTTSPMSGWTAAGNVVTGTAVSAVYFDLCSYDATSAFLVHVAAGNFVLAKIGATGTVSGSAVVFAGTGVPTVYAESGQNRVMVAWLTAAGALTVRSYSGSLAGSVGPTVLDTQATHMGQPTVGPDGTGTFRVSISQEDAVTALDQQVRTWNVNIATHAAAEDFDHTGCRLASKVLALGGSKWSWVVNKSSFDRTYYLRDLLKTMPFTVTARGVAVDATDSDSHVSEFVSYTAGTRTFALWAAPVVVGQDASVGSPLTGVDLVRIEYGGTERFQGASIGGNLYLTGGLLSMFDGALAHEVSFLDEPRIVSAVAGGGGALTAGKTYQYLLTHHWLDANGRLHLSGVSDPVSVAMGANTSVALKLQRPKQTWRSALFWRDTTLNPQFRIRQHIWRTEGDGTIFHQLTDELGYSVVPADSYGSMVSLTDVQADTAITAKAVVYTQGARGALSGPLQHDPPPPCRYIWAGKERAIIGGLETPGELRWSKFFFPGEALEFSEDVAFRKLVPGTVRAVAALDDVWLAFTDSQIFVVTGVGPDDTGAGSFDEPRALPTDVGIVTWKSLVEWSGGLFFQGEPDMLYLLPRGIGSPQPQFATLAPLRQYPTVTSARLLTEDNLVVFTLTGGAGGKGALLCFDVQNGQWTVDEIAGGVEHTASAVTGGNLLLSTGAALDVENPSAHMDRTTQFVPVSIETAALRPHGMQADGRTRKVAVLGEYRADCSLKMELAPDDAQTYPYSKTWNLGADTVGNVLRREWDLPVQKFGACTLRISEVQNGSNANEGFVLHGLTLDTRPRPGMPRLNAGRR